MILNILEAYRDHLEKYYVASSVADPLSIISYFPIILYELPGISIHQHTTYWGGGVHIIC